ncbi:MAG TPA: cupredoxin domain-containing protein [Xanthobacteraceae bacterium]|nr:cupredoxin domain-containing protein [Xanthobacteraceae bacterium]
MTRESLTRRTATVLASALVLGAALARADDTVTLSLTIKDHQFEPAEVHAPAGKPITFRVKNLDSIAAEFESSELHFEKVIAAGGEATVHVRALAPGRYNFFDDFHRQTQGFLVVP